jgi:hypothetical protein
MDNRETQPRLRHRHLSALPLLLTLLVACSSPAKPTDPASAPQPSDSTQVQVTPTPSSKNQAYDWYDSLVRRLTKDFQSPTAERFMDYPNNQVYYGFDPAMAWGKREKTIVDGDENKPSQYEFVYVSKRTEVVTIVNVIYIPKALEPDIVGFVGIPGREDKTTSGRKLKLNGDYSRTELFSYYHALFVLHSFPLDPTKASGDDLVQAKRELGTQLRQFLDKQLDLNQSPIIKPGAAM